MVSNEPKVLHQVAEMMKAMGHPLRLQIMAIIVVKQFVSIPTLQKELAGFDPFTLYSNLRYMEKKGLLKKLRKGREIYYGVSEKALSAGFDFFFWKMNIKVNPD